MFRATIAARTSRNNWIGLLCFVALAIFSILYWSGEDGGVALLVLAASVLASAFSIYSILRGSEWEIVIDEECVRWGNVSKKSKQKRIPLGVITKFRFTDYDSTTPFEFVSKAGVNHGVPAFLLAEKDEEESLISYLREHHPKIQLDLERRK